MAKVKTQKQSSVAEPQNQTTAFMSRSKKEEERQQTLMSQKLRNDMLRMRREEIFPDMQYMSGSVTYPGHQLIIRSRLHDVEMDDWFESSPGELPVLRLSHKSPEECKAFLDTLYTSEHLDTDFIIRGLKLPDHVNISDIIHSNKSTDSCHQISSLDDSLTSNGEREPESADLSSSSSSQIAVSPEGEKLASPTLPDSMGKDGEMPSKNGTTSNSETGQEASRENGSHADTGEARNGHVNVNDSAGKGFADTHRELGSGGDSEVLPESHAPNSQLPQSGQGDSSVKETFSAPDSEANGNGGHSDQINKEKEDIEVVSSSSEVSPVKDPLTPEQSADVETASSSLKESPVTESARVGSGGETESNGESNKKDISYRPCSNLASDLLQWYQSSDQGDCCLKVEGQKLMAHRCILATRCEYFSAMFAGSWSESDEMEIELLDVKARSMKYILLFLYGAMVDVPITDITAVIQASDMYGVEGFKDWLCFQIARDYCHFFHKPCQDCTRMVPDVLVLASQFNLTDLSERANRWMATHFRRIWEMQTFGSLPPALLEECTKAVIEQLSVQNITQIILDAHDLARTLQQNHRSEQVQIAAIQITDRALAFCAQHFPQLVKSPNFLSWSKSGAWCLDLLAESYTMAVSLLQPGAVCEVYTSLRNQLNQCEKAAADGGGDYSSEEVQELLRKLVKRCEWYFHRYIHGVMQCPQWDKLPKELQQELLQKSSFVPVHTASAVAAQSRVAQKSAKALQDNIEHTVSMLCETDPTLFPSLAQTRKILANNAKQHPPKRSDARKTVGAKPDTKSASQQKGVGKTAAATSKGHKSTTPAAKNAPKQSRTGKTTQTAAEGTKEKQSGVTSVPSPRPSSVKISREQTKTSAPSSSQAAARPDSARSRSQGTGASSAAKSYSVKSKPTQARGADTTAKSSPAKMSQPQAKSASAPDKVGKGSAVDSSQEQVIGATAPSTSSRPDSAKSKTTGGSAGPSSSQKSAAQSKTASAHARPNSARSSQMQTAESFRTPKPSSFQASKAQGKASSATTQPSLVKSSQQRTKATASAMTPRPSSSSSSQPQSKASSAPARPRSAKDSQAQPTSKSASASASRPSSARNNQTISEGPASAKSLRSSLDHEGDNSKAKPATTTSNGARARPSSASTGPRPGSAKKDKGPDKSSSAPTVPPSGTKSKFPAAATTHPAKALLSSFTASSSGAAASSARERAALYAKGVAGKNSALNSSKAGPSSTSKPSAKVVPKTDDGKSQPAQTKQTSNKEERVDSAVEKQPPANKLNSAVGNGKTSHEASSRGTSLSSGTASSQVHEEIADQDKQGNEATQTSVTHAENNAGVEPVDPVNSQVESLPVIISTGGGDPDLQQRESGENQIASGEDGIVPQPSPVPTTEGEETPESVHHQDLEFSNKYDQVSEPGVEVAVSTQVSKDAEETMPLTAAVEVDKFSVGNRKQDSGSLSETEQPSVAPECAAPKISETTEPSIIEHQLFDERDTTETKAPERKGIEPKATETEIIQSQPLQPETTETKASEPETSEPKASEPETTEAQPVEPGTVEATTIQADGDLSGQATPTKTEIPPEETESSTSPVVICVTEYEDMSEDLDQHETSPSAVGRTAIPTIVIDTGDDSSDSTEEEAPVTVTKETSDTADSTSRITTEGQSRIDKTAVPVITIESEDEVNTWGSPELSEQIDATAEGESAPTMGLESDLNSTSQKEPEKSQESYAMGETPGSHTQGDEDGTSENRSQQGKMRTSFHSMDEDAATQQDCQQVPDCSYAKGKVLHSLEGRDEEGASAAGILAENDKKQENLAQTSPHGDINGNCREQSKTGAATRIGEELSSENA